MTVAYETYTPPDVLGFYNCVHCEYPCVGQIYISVCIGVRNANQQQL